MTDTTTNTNASPAKTGRSYVTTAAYLSGGICGKLWMPCAMAGLTIRKNLRGYWGFFDKGDTFREALLSLLRREGGDFQNAQFTADTVLRIERRSVESAGRHTVHVWEREIGQLPDCSDLVNADAYTGDFLGEE
jgi:hypothetical protein